MTLTDHKVPVKEVDTATMVMLMNMAQKLRQEIVALTPTTYTRMDAAGKVTEQMTISGGEHSKISAMEQMNDMLEQALFAATNQNRLLEAKEQEG